jgi:hypothetical protein
MNQDGFGEIPVGSKEYYINIYPKLSLLIKSLQEGKGISIEENKLIKGIPAVSVGELHNTFNNLTNIKDESSTHRDEVYLLGDRRENNLVIKSVSDPSMSELVYKSQLEAFKQGYPVVEPVALLLDNVTSKEYYVEEAGVLFKAYFNKLTEELGDLDSIKNHIEKIFNEFISVWLEKGNLPLDFDEESLVKHLLVVEKMEGNKKTKKMVMTEPNNISEITELKKRYLEQLSAYSFEDIRKRFLGGDIEGLAHVDQLNKYEKKLSDKRHSLVSHLLAIEMNLQNMGDMEFDRFFLETLNREKGELFPAHNDNNNKNISFIDLTNEYLLSLHGLGDFDIEFSEEFFQQYSKAIIEKLQSIRIYLDEISDRLSKTTIIGDDDRKLIEITDLLVRSIFDDVTYLNFLSKMEEFINNEGTK